MPTRREFANAIRALSMDAAQKANSGHPGAPMGMADIAEVLWRDVLKFNPGNPLWWDRDRFVLSNGHASMLLYSVLHLTGYPLPMDELKKFRQFGSLTPGHPERDVHLGIETTTGPLGQGFANAVGMALAERSLAATFNRPGHTILDHHTYGFLGDGCMMEGISHEVASFAGMQRLGKLILVYDDNGISIDGKVKGWFADDAPRRFEAYGWHVLPHEEIAAARERLGWTSPPFEIPVEIRAGWDMREKGERAEREWRAKFAAYQAGFPALAGELTRRITGDLPSGFDALAKACIDRARRLRADRLRGGARSHRHRHRIRSRHRRRGPKHGAAGAPGALGVHAEQHHLRTPGRGLQAQRVAAVGHAPRGGGGGRTRTVVALRGPQGPDRRHRHFRRFGAGARIVQAFWIHARPCEAGNR
jgi:transketolase